MHVVERCSKKVSGTLLDEQSFFRDWCGAFQNKMIGPQALRSKVQILVRHDEPLGYVWTKESTSQEYVAERALRPNTTLETCRSHYMLILQIYLVSVPKWMSYES